ncbi:MAG: class II glutamine amidotransferase [Gemmatimonadota bacterium]|nr:class II glutamine amidotransferase [Gemmatimonadota bacterium]
MCRLIAYLGDPLPPGHLVFDGEHSLYEQSWAPRELLSGTINADGYGVVWYSDGRPARLAEVRPIWYDTDLCSTLSSLRSGCVLAGLRNGTVGLPLDRSGLPPLVFEKWSFMLDGFVPDFRVQHMRALRAQLPDDLYAELRGSSDSETLFLSAVAAMREGATMAEALERTAKAVHDRVGRATEAQMNMVLSDGERIAAVRSGTVLVTNSLYFAKRPPFAPEGVVLASERLDPGAVWEPVDGHSWIEIGPELDVRSEGIFF